MTDGPVEDSAPTQSGSSPARLGWRRLRTRQQQAVSRPLRRWLALLRALAVLNIALWIACAMAVITGNGARPLSDAVELQLLLSAAYVLGCAFRSALPVYDIPRRVLIDSALSSVLVGRSVATVAELCFAGQWALMLHRFALLSGAALVDAAALAILPLIVVAEICSWHAVLTTAQRGHLLENSLWGLCAVLVVASLLRLGPARPMGLQTTVIAWCLGGSAYAAFLFLFDVPMYRDRWRADQRIARRYLSVAEGLLDAARRRSVCWRWEHWRSEVPWMSLYFSFGVWSSLSLIHAAAVVGSPR